MAALGVTEPYSAGIGGGGFLVYYDAKNKKVTTLDGRETAPKSFTEQAFIDPATGKPYVFATAVTSGRLVGCSARRRSGRRPPTSWTMKFHQLMQPAVALALKGFTVDQIAHDQTPPRTRPGSALPRHRGHLPAGGNPPAVGSTFRNRDLAKTYIQLAARGTSWLYDGKLGDAIVAEAQHPSTKPGSTVMGGS